MGIFFKILLASLVLTAITGWGCAAVYFGDSNTDTIQVVVAAAFGLSGLATLIGYIINRWRYRLMLGHMVLFIGVLIW